MRKGPLRIKYETEKTLQTVKKGNIKHFYFFDSTLSFKNLLKMLISCQASGSKTTPPYLSEYVNGKSNFVTRGTTTQPTR